MTFAKSAKHSVDIIGGTRSRTITISAASDDTTYAQLTSMLNGESIIPTDNYVTDGSENKFFQSLAQRANTAVDSNDVRRLQRGAPGQACPNSGNNNEFYQYMIDNATFWHSFPNTLG